MSVEILLIPVGIAAITAIRESLQSHESQDIETRHPTQVRDPSLLMECLQDGGYKPQQDPSGRTVLTWEDSVYVVERLDGIYTVSSPSHHADPGSFAETINFLSGRVLQRRNLKAIQAEASRLGLTLIHQEDQNGAIQLVYEGELRA